MKVPSWDRELGLAEWNIWNVFAALAFPLRMKRYYFDIRQDDDLAADEEGLIMRDVDAVQKEAALSLADMARETVPGGGLHRMAIEVRDDIGPVLEVAYLCQIRRIER